MVIEPVWPLSIVLVLVLTGVVVSSAAIAGMAQRLRARAALRTAETGRRIGNPPLHFGVAHPDTVQNGVASVNNGHPLTADNSQVLEHTVQAWLDEMRAAGIRLTIVSNNTAKRVRPFAERIGLDWVPLACKPFTIGLRVARRRLGCKKSEMAMVGDQIFADRMAAGLYGCPCLYLMPRTNHDKNKFVLLKRKFEPYWIDKYYRKGGKLYE